MTASLGRVVAALAAPTDQIPTNLIDLINDRIDPPNRLDPHDVHVRAMYVVSDEVNSFGGCFPPEEHPRLAELLVDSPVMVGHRKDKLPIGRTFHAVTTERDGRPWVKGYFYWLRSDKDAERLRDNIDGGVYRECSVAFTFLLPECSICGNDIRRCEHQPLQRYRIGGTETPCHFNYRRLERVLETSLVYRGAVPDTRITNDLSSLNPNARYLITPRYESIPVIARTGENQLVLERVDGAELPVDLRAVDWRPIDPTRALLLGYRGKERCTVDELEDYLAERPGPVSRLVLNIFPSGGETVSLPDRRSSLEVKVIPHRVAAFDEIDFRSREIMTRLGVELRPLKGDNLADSPEPGFIYMPGEMTTVEKACRLSTGERSFLTLIDGRERRCFEVCNFERDRLAAGRRFVAKPESDTPPGCLSSGSVTRASLVEWSATGDHVRFRTQGDFEGEFRLRPIKLQGETCFLFHRLPNEIDSASKVMSDRVPSGEMEESKHAQPDPEPDSHDQ